MTNKEKKILKQRFEEFEKNQPDEIILHGARLNGGNLILHKKYIRGVPVYSAPLDVPLLGEM